MNKDILQSHISAFKDRELPRMVEGQAYYKSKNTKILNREKEFFSIASNKNIRDYTKANHKLASGYTKILVDQKLYYSINKNMVIEGFQDLKVIDIKKFKAKLKKVGKEATNKIYSVVYWFAQDGELKYKLMKSEQMILAYNKDDNSELDYAIRVYVENGIDHADVIGKETIQYWVKGETDWILDPMKPETFHIIKTTKSGSLVVSEESSSWGKVPLSVMYNNDERQTDLEMFKSYIDMYDINMSDFGNNLDDFQEMYWVLKGYKGQDAEEFMTEFKKSRIIKVGSEGDAKQVAQEVPYEARKAMSEMLNKDIYRWGMGVDPDNISGDTTNLTIKAQFANLDLKANGFEEQMQEFVDDCAYFLNKFNEINNNAERVVDSEITFDRSTIFNKQEIISGLIAQRGFRADSILLGEHPDVNNVEEELAALDAQREKELKALGGSMGFGDKIPDVEDIPDVEE